MHLMDEDASKVIAQHESITLSDDVFVRFMHACENAKQPNKALREALTFTRKQDIK